MDEELGFRPDIIEHQLAHRVIDPWAAPTINEPPAREKS